MDAWRVWEKVEAGGDVFSARTGHLMVDHDGEFYLFGGTDKKRRQNDLYRFDVQRKAWVKVKVSGEVPCRRSGALAVVHDGNMYCFGGYNGRDGSYFNDLFCFNFQRNEWKKIVTKSDQAAVPNARCDHCLGVYDNKLIVFGGFDGVLRYHDCHAFDLKTREWSELATECVTKPSRRFGHTGVVHGGKLYVFGGWDGKKTLNCVWMLDLVTETWSSLDSLKRATTMMEFSYSRKNVCPSSSSVTTNAIQYDEPLESPMKRKRTKSPTRTAGEELAYYRPENRYRHSAVLHENSMIIFGGVDQDHQRFNDIQRFSFDTLEWEKLDVIGRIPTSRTFHRAVVVGGDMYIAAGFDGVDRLNDLYKVNVGPLSPLPLTEICATYIRNNLATVLHRRQFDNVPPFMYDTAIWTRDCIGTLRGANLPICPKFTRRPDGPGPQEIVVVKNYNQQQEDDDQDIEMKHEDDDDDDAGNDSKINNNNGKNGAPEDVCAICGKPSYDHDIVIERELLQSATWEPDYELFEESALRPNDLPEEQDQMELDDHQSDSSSFITCPKSDSSFILDDCDSENDGRQEDSSTGASNSKGLFHKPRKILRQLNRKFSIG